MLEHPINAIMNSAMENLKEMVDVNTIVGDAITSPDGTVVIPVSKVAMGIATGGIDYGNKHQNEPQNFGGGGGTGVSITPVAFLTVNKNAEVNLITIDSSSQSGIDNTLSLIERTPEIIKKIKDTLT